MNAPAFRWELSAAQKTGRKAWREPIAGIKDQVMACTTHSSRSTRASSWRGAALAWAVLAVAACQTQPAPEVHGEPRQAAPSSGAEARPAAASAPVELARVQAAKYEGDSHEGKAEGAHAAGAAAAHARAEAKPAATVAGTHPPHAEAVGAETPQAGAKPTQGAVVSEEPFSVWLQAQSPVVAGGAAQVEAVLVAKAPYHCNAEYPHKFKLNAPPAGLTYPAEVVKGMVVTPERGVLRIPVQAQSAGPATVSGTLSFSVCTDERCLVEKRDLTLNLVVN